MPSTPAFESTAMGKAATCPLCGQANACAQAGQARAVEACWCFQVSIDAETLRRVPAASGMGACLCHSCAQGLGAESGR